MTNALTMLRKADGTVKGSVANQAAAFRQDNTEANRFAPLRQGNKVKAYTTGKEYFKDVHAAMKAATKSIFITGWAINWDVELIEGVRLIDVLHDRVESSENFRVYVLPWLSPKVGVDNGDFETTLAIFQLNAGRKHMQAMCCPAGAQSDFTGVEAALFAHHQKVVVVDNEIGFLGGMDLAYGRCDDDHFSLAIGTRQCGERYNLCIPPMHRLTPKEDASCLSLSSLLLGTLGAAHWNVGSNTDPGALKTFLKDSLSVSDALAVSAVGLVNEAARLDRLAARALFDSSKAVGHAVAASVNAGEDVAIAASEAVSQQCGALKIPDLYGNVQSQKLDVAAKSGLPESIRHGEEAARRGYNESVEALAALADFLEPLRRLRVDPNANSGAADMAAGSERGVRAGANVFIDSAAALAGSAQTIAEGAKQVCVGIAPVLKAGVNGVNSAADGIAQTAHATANAVNEFQRQIVESFTRVRQRFNDGVRSAIAKGASVIYERTRPAAVDAVLEELKQLLKVCYLAQLAINWQHATRHPLLLNRKVKAAPPGLKVLSDAQVREPWQDVSCRIEGDAVYDLAMNFIGRWNAAQESYLANATWPDAGRLASQPGAPRPGPQLRALAMIPAALVPRPPLRRPPAPPSDIAVRILRSASLKQQKQEALSMKTSALRISTQHEIKTQMINLITGATDFIYIENQFFEGDFGVPSINPFAANGSVERVLADASQSAPLAYLMDSKTNKIKAGLSTLGLPDQHLLPKNGVCAAIGTRIEKAVRWGMPFHVYIVLPVHPDGPLNDILIVGQIHWTFQCLVHADHSLINRIRRAIAAKNICDERAKNHHFGNENWKAAMDEAGVGERGRRAYELILEEQWGKYLTLLNLRNCEIIAGTVRTEQIYVHSKVMIVDDREVLLGSANINDRSMNGDRDSEISAIFFDTATEKAVLRDKTVIVTPFARKLRMDLWLKHFAITGRGNDIVKAADEMDELIKTPAADKTISEIQRLARRNSNAYRTFPFVPWSDNSDEPNLNPSIWPTCSRKIEPGQVNACAAGMPFDERFWRSTSHLGAPKGIRGFFTALPINWTLGQNNHPDLLNVMALTMRDQSSDKRTA